MTMSKMGILSVLAVFAFGTAACGGAEPPPQSADDEEFDAIASIVGEVEIDEADLEEEEGDEAVAAYTGPCKVTVNLKVVNNENPEGSFKLVDSNGTTLVESGNFGDVVELNPGTFSIEFKTPAVFGNPVHSVQLDVAGKEMTVNEIFPAGQITLHTFRGKAQGRCIPTMFTLFNIGNAEPVQVGTKGKTCKPLVVQTGHYEVRLNLSKKKYQPVEMRINREQVQTSKVKLE